MWVASGFSDYECIDAKDGEKLERWGSYILRRPDPQVIWKSTKENDLWDKADAHYHRSSKGGGQWTFNSKLPEKWTVSYKDLRFYIKPMGFKHTGLFPEQAVNWDYIIDKLSKRKGQKKVLNLFAYTGGATMAAAYAGADVVHVDASKGMVTWAKENLHLSNLGNRFVRFIVDDCEKFVEREIRRGNKYDGIIMDPPSYGRGPNGEVWKLEDKLFDFVLKAKRLLSDEPAFFIINSYTTGLQPQVIKNILHMALDGGKAEAGEIGLPIASHKNLILPCGATGRWEIG